MPDTKTVIDSHVPLPEPKRLISTIEFPYHDLEDIEKVAKGVHEIAGMSCSTDQLAAHLSQPATSGGFRMRLIAARMFGMLRYENGVVTLTDLGARLSDPQQERAARAEAFLRVPLYLRLYEQFRGKTLPGNLGLENAIVTLGVSPKQKDKARQAFQRSAKFAGFFEFGQDRLVQPVSKQPGTSAQQAMGPQVEDITPKMQDRSSITSGFHPFIQGLLEKLPGADENWTVEARAKWLQTAANIFDLMYVDPDGKGTIVVELKQGKDK
jgi:hypothetical protein